MANNKVVLELIANDERFKVAIQKLSKESGDLEGKLKKLGGPIDDIGRKFSSSVVGGIKGAISSVFSFQAAIVAAAGAFVVNKIIKAANEQEKAIQSVAVAMQRTGEYSRDALSDVEGFAGALERLTGVADDQVLKMFSVAKSFGATNDKAKDLTQAAIELSAATGKGTDEAISQLSKTLGGFAGELGEVNPKIRALTAEQLKAGEAAKIILQQYGGTAAGLIDNFAGSTQKVANSFDNVLESIGNIIVKNPVMNELMKDLSRGLEKLARFIDKNADGFRGFVNKGIRGVLGALPDLLRAIGILGEAFELIDNANPLKNVADDAKAANTALDGTASTAIILADAILQVQQGFYEIQRVANQVNSVGGLFKLPGLASGQTFEDPTETIKANLERIEELRQRLANKTVEVVTPEGVQKVSDLLNDPKNAADELADALERIAKKYEEIGDIAVEPTIAPQITPGQQGTGSAPGPMGPGLDAPLLDFGPVVNTLLKIPKILDTIGTSFIKNLGGGQDGARKLMGDIAGGVAMAFGASGPMAEGISQIVQLLGQDPEAFRAQIDAFVEGIPIIIDNIVENIPYLMETLAANSGEIITALANASPRIAVALAESMPMVAMALANELTQGMDYQINIFGNALRKAGADFSDEFKRAVPDFLKSGFRNAGADIKAEFAGIRDILKGAVAAMGEDLKGTFGKAADRFADEIVNAGKRFLNMISGGGGGGRGGINTGTPIDYLDPRNYTGGSAIATQAGPSLLSPAEMDLAGSRGVVGSAGTSGSGGDTDVLLARVIDLLQRPITVETTAEIDGRALADIQLTLNRTYQRTAA